MSRSHINFIAFLKSKGYSCIKRDFHLEYHYYYLTPPDYQEDKFETLEQHSEYISKAQKELAKVISKKYHIDYTGKYSAYLIHQIRFDWPKFKK